MKKNVRLVDLKEFLQKHVIHKINSAKTVVLLFGEMGSGKTQCVKYLVELLEGVGAVSPTFSIIQEYETDRGLVNHVDLYRIESKSDLESTGFWELFSKKSGIIFIEWPEKLGKVSFGDWHVIEIHLAFKKEVDVRLITVKM